MATNYLKEIYQLTKGYPYLLQEWGYQCWNYAKDTPIELQDVKDAQGGLSDCYKIQSDALLQFSNPLVYLINVHLSNRKIYGSRWQTRRFWPT